MCKDEALHRKNKLKPSYTALSALKKLNTRNARWQFQHQIRCMYFQDYLVIRCEAEKGHRKNNKETTKKNKTSLQIFWAPAQPVAIVAL